MAVKSYPLRINTKSDKDIFEAIETYDKWKDAIGNKRFKSKNAYILAAISSFNLLLEKDIEKSKNPFEIAQYMEYNDRKIETFVTDIVYKILRENGSLPSNEDIKESNRTTSYEEQEVIEESTESEIDEEALAFIKSLELK
jgi:hypothetical protein